MALVICILCKLPSDVLIATLATGHVRPAQIRERVDSEVSWSCLWGDSDTLHGVVVYTHYQTLLRLARWHHDRRCDNRRQRCALYYSNQLGTMAAALGLAG
jgi:hypothetical protein